MIERARFYKIMLASENVPSFKESMRLIIETLVKDGTQYMLEDNVEYKIPVELSISYISSAYLGVIIWWLENDMPYTPKFMATQLTRMSTVGPYVKNPYIH